MKRFVFGCGSQALYVLENLLACGEQLPDAFVNLERAPTSDFYFEGISVLSYDEAMMRCNPSDTLVLVAHGSNKLKLFYARQLETRGFSFFNAVHPSSVISPMAEISIGCIINASAIILPKAKVGSHVIVHSGAIIEHDCVLGVGCNIAPGAVMAGGVSVGSGAYLYTGCAIAPRVTIGDGAIIAAGAIVLSSVEEGTKVAGCPAHLI